MFFFSNEVQVGKFEVEKLANVVRPHLKSLPLNCYMLRNKNLCKKLSNIWKLSCTNVKFDLKLVTLTKNFTLTHLKLEAFNNLKNLSCTLSQTSTLQLTTIRRSLFHTFSNLNVESLNNSKKHSSTFENLQHFDTTRNLVIWC
jgi:hypothetical protein